MHHLPLIGKNDVDNKITQRAAVLKVHGFLEILHIDGINIGADIVHGAAFLPQGLLHNIQEDSENHVELLVHCLEFVFFPCGLLDAVLD